MEAGTNGRTVVWTEGAASPRAMLGGLGTDALPRTPRILASPVAYQVKQTTQPISNTRVRLARGKTSTMAVWSTGGPAGLTQPQVFAQELNDNGTPGAPVSLGT